MPPRDVLTAIAVAVVWGLMFIAIKIGVAETTPLALSALRFAFAALPLVLFVRPPKASPAVVVLYGLFIGVVDSAYLVRMRRYAVVAVTGIAAILTPPDLISMLSLVVPMLLLYEGSVIAVRVVEKRRKASNPSST